MSFIVQSFRILITLLNCLFDFTIQLKYCISSHYTFYENLAFAKIKANTENHFRFALLQLQCKFLIAQEKEQNNEKLVQVEI